MEKNQNDDNRNQDTSDNESTQKINQDNGRKITDPNNPVAIDDKNKRDENTNHHQNDPITNRDKSITNQNKANPWLKNSNRTDKETDEEELVEKTDMNKKKDLNTKKNENESEN